MKVTEYRKDGKNKQKEIIDILSEEINDTQDGLKRLEKTNKIITDLKNRASNDNLFPLSNEELLLIYKSVIVSLGKIPEKFDDNRSTFSATSEELSVDKYKIMDTILIDEMYKGTPQILKKVDYYSLKNKFSSCKDVWELFGELYKLINDEKYGHYVKLIYCVFVEGISPYKTTHFEERIKYIEDLKRIRKCILNNSIISSNLLKAIYDYNGSSNINIKETLSVDAIKLYNEKVYVTKYRERINKEIMKVKKEYFEPQRNEIEQLTRPERMRIYQENKNKDSTYYNDAGDIILTEEEKLYLQMYLDVISDIDDIEDFINQISIKIPFEEDIDFVKVLNELNNKINSSDSYDIVFKKKITKAIVLYAKAFK